MAHLYFDESGGWDKDILLICGFLTFDPQAIFNVITNFEDSLYSKIEYQNLIEDYERVGLHACENDASVMSLFTKLFSRIEGRFVFAFTRESKGTKELYIEMMSRLASSLIIKTNKRGEPLDLYYEKSDSYLSGSNFDNLLLFETISRKISPDMIFTVSAKDKEFKPIALVDYAANIVYKNIIRELNKQPSSREKLSVSLYKLIEQNTSLIYDFDRSKSIEPRKTSPEERDLANWII